MHWFKISQRNFTPASSIKLIKTITRKSRIDFIKKLEAIRKSDRSELLNTVNGVGTWMHEGVILDIPKFHG